MAHVTYFIQPCPACGRTLHVRIEYMGRTVGCQHCGRKFVSYDAEDSNVAPSDSAISLLNRADALLERAAHAHPE